MVHFLRRFHAAALVCALAFLTAARGDIIHLKRGSVEGVIVEQSEQRLVVETKGGGKVVLDPADVVRIERRATPLSVYHEMAAKVDPKDAAGHYALGLWATEQKLYREARQEFEKTLTLDPDHKGARERLGYVQKDGKWLTRAEAKQAEGLVLHEGKWVTPEERDAAQRRQASAGWQRRLRAAIARGPFVADRIAARLTDALGAEADESAQEALRQVLDDLVREALDAKTDRTSEARIALVKLLAEKPSVPTNELLRRVAMQDRDDPVRAKIIKTLAAQKNVENTAYFVSLLDRFTGPRYRVNGTKKTRATARRVLRRAAYALGELDDARAIPALAKTLFVRFHIPEQADELPPMSIGLSTPKAVGSAIVTDSHGNQMLVPVQEETNWGLNVSEPPPQVEDGFFFNEAAYAALRKLTGQDFSTDKNAWLAWWYRNRHNLVE